MWDSIAEIVDVKGGVGGVVFGVLVGVFAAALRRRQGATQAGGCYCGVVWRATRSPKNCKRGPVLRRGTAWHRGDGADNALLTSVFGRNGGGAVLILVPFVTPSGVSHAA